MEVAGLPGVSRDFHFWQPAPPLRLAKQRNPAKSPHTIGNEQAPATLKKKISGGVGGLGVGGGGRKWLEVTLRHGQLSTMGNSLSKLIILSM